MEDEGLVIEDEFHTCHSEPADSETEPLLRATPSTYEKFRLGRETEQSSRWIMFILAAFKVCFCSLGLWGHRAWKNIIRVLLVIVCVYKILVISYSWVSCLPRSKSNCGNLTASQRRICNIIYITTAGNTTLAMASILSYLVFIGCCVAAKCKKLVLFSTSQSRDIDKADICRLFLVFLITNVFLTVPVVMVFPQIDWPWSDNLLCDILGITGSATFFFIQWVSLNICHIFSAYCYALGTFAQDTRRIIREVRNGTIDDVIRIHEDLCTVVFSTVSACSMWFVVHWLTHGAGAIIVIVLIFVEMPQATMLYDVCYGAVFLVNCLFLFLFPCVCAARITSQCAGIYEEINCTTSDDWNEGHPFKDRRNIALFISYAEKRRCGFKVRRITFDTSLAWVAFFFGLLSLLYPLIQHEYTRSSFD